MQIIAPDLGIKNRSDIKLLIHPTGADQSQAITDASVGGPKTITVAGNTKIVAQDMRHPYARSAISFDGASYLSTPDSADWAEICGSASWTMEGWFFPKTFSAAQIIFSRYQSVSPFTGSRFYINSSGKIGHASGSTLIFTTTSSLFLNVWNYVAIVCNGTIVYVYINSVKDTTTSTTMLVNYSASLLIGVGNDIASSNMFNGYIADVRISNIARYSASTVPVPTAPLPSDSYTKLLIRGDNVTQPTTFVDASPSPKTITATGSVRTVSLPPGASAAYFDGSGDYLTIPDSADFNFCSGDFSIHLWTMFLSNVETPFAGKWGGSSLRGWCADYYNGYLKFFYSTTGSDLPFFSIAWTPVLSMWYHIAFVRASNLLIFFINGVELSRFSMTGAIYSPSTPLVVAGGAYNLGTGNLYMKDLTIIKGRALWTRNFTPPNRLA